MSDYEKLEYEAGKLRDFAQDIMEMWPYGGSWDASDLQEIAVEHGLLKSEIRHVGCGNDECPCFCEETCTSDEFVAGVKCFRKTPLLTGQ